MVEISMPVSEVLEDIAARAEKKLLSLSEQDLRENWHFKWDPKHSTEWNIYEFFNSLEHFKRCCRRWEEHHNGHTCVVERVREKYLCPKIKELLGKLSTDFYAPRP